MPPIVTFTGRAVVLPPFGVTPPVTLAGAVAPSPVAKNCTTEPRAAGFEALLTELSWLSAAACPTPIDPAAKMPGADGASGTPQAADSTPLKTTSTVAVPVVPTSYGTMAFTCVAEA